MRTDKSTPMPASSPAIHTSEDPRHVLIRQGRKLEYFTIAYNSLEGIVSIVAGLFAGSISLIGFGLDSFIEVTSAASLIWRFGRDRDEARRAAAERTSLRIVGLCFIGLAAYIAYDSRRSAGTQHPRYPYRIGIPCGNASTRKSQTQGRKRHRQFGHARGCASNRLLHVSFRNPAGGTASERAVWFVAGRSGSGPVHGTRHRERRGRRSARPISVRMLV